VELISAQHMTQRWVYLLVYLMIDIFVTEGARARPTWCQAYRPLIDLVLEYNFLKGIGSETSVHVDIRVESRRNTCP